MKNVFAIPLPTRRISGQAAPAFLGSGRPPQNFAIAAANTASDATAPNNVIDEQNLRSSGLPSISRIVLPSTALTSEVHSASRGPKTPWAR
jgi:hypothetical protein